MGSKCKSDLAAYLILACCLCAPLLTNAHRQHLSWTQVVLEEGKNSVQITHRLHQHDSLALLASMGFTDPNLESIEHLAVLAVYASRNTQLIQQGGTLANTEIIGAELEGDFVFVYQEVIDEPTRLWKLRTSIFMDINPDQINRVNLLYKDRIVSWEFRAEDSAKVVTIREAPAGTP